MSEHQRYKLLYKLDAGGMAEIFRAKALSVSGIEKDVAIKRITPALAQRPKFVRMFLDEARLAMTLNHANIVQVFDVGRAQDTYFIVMEFVDGWNLRRILHRVNEVGTRLPVGLAVFIAIEALKGLAYAHEKKDENGRPLRIVHRDVSPPNILISKAGEVKITDFGLAKAVTQAELTDPGIVKGKFAYLSPEAVQGKPVDHRADIFAMGIILWEMLTNRRLFLGRDEQETIDKVRACKIPSIRPFNKEVDEDLENIVRKALAKDPKKRIPTAAKFADMLSEYLFKQKLKVTSNDLREFLGELFEEKEEDEGRAIHAIGTMIQEEILSLSMVKYSGKPMPVEGEKPIKLEEIQYTGEDKIKVEEIFGDASEVVLKPETSKDSPPREVVQKADSSGSPLLWVAIFFGILLVLGILGYFVYETFF